MANFLIKYRYIHLVLQNVKQRPDTSVVNIVKDISNIKGLWVSVSIILKTLNSAAYYDKIPRKKKGSNQQR